MVPDIGLGRMFVEAEGRLTSAESEKYEQTYRLLKKLVDYDSAADMLALTRFVIETKERFGLSG